MCSVGEGLFRDIAVQVYSDIYHVMSVLVPCSVCSALSCSCSGRNTSRPQARPSEALWPEKHISASVSTILTPSDTLPPLALINIGDGLLQDGFYIASEFIN